MQLPPRLLDTSATTRRHLGGTRVGLLLLGLLMGLGCAGAPARSAGWQETQRRDTPLEQIPFAQDTSQPQSGDELNEAQRARLELARRNCQNGDYAEAVEDLKSLREKDGVENHDIDLLLAQVYLRTGDAARALEAAQAALRYRPGSAEAHATMGAAYRRTGDLEKAIRHFRAATRATGREASSPQITWAWYQLGVALSEAGYLRAAEQALANFDRSIWETHPEHRDLKPVADVLEKEPYGGLLRRLDLLERLGETKARTRLASEAAQRWRDDAHVARLYVLALLDAGEAAEAFEVCRPWLRREPPPPTIVGLAIDAAMQSGRLNEWIDRLCTDVQRGERAALARTVLRHLSAQRAPQATLRLAQGMLAAGHDAFEIAQQVAAARAVLEGLDAAFDALLNFVRQHPDGWRLTHADLERWAALVRTCGQPTEVLERVRQRAVSEDPATLFLAGLTAYAAGDASRALEDLEGAAHGDSTFVAPCIARSLILLSACRWQDALEAADALLEEHPKLAAAHFIRAEALNGLDENREAEPAYRRAIRYDPNEPSYRLALAKHYRRLDNLLGAQRYYRETLTLDPLCDEALEGLIESYLWGGKLEVARAELKRMRAVGVSETALRHVETLMRHIDDPGGEAYLRDLREQHRRYPDDLKTAGQLAGALVQAERYDEAIELLEELRRRAPRDDDLARLAWQTQRLRAAFREAADVLEELRQRYPNRLEVLRPLAYMRLYSLDPDRARPLFERLIELDTEQADAYRRLLIDALSQMGRADDALALIDRQLRDKPGDARWMLEKLSVLTAAERNDEAFQLAASWLDDKPDDEVRRRAWVAAGAAAQQYDTVLPRVREWLEEDRDAARTWADSLIQVLLAAGQFDEALKTAREFQGTWDDAIDMRIAAARCLAEAERVDEAVVELEALLSERAVSADRRRVAQRTLLAVLTDAERYDDALQRCDEWLEATTDDDQGWRSSLLDWKRAILQAAGREDEALKIMERIYGQQPQDAGLNNDLGYTWADRGVHLDKALKMTRLAVVAEPLNAAFLDSLGWVYYKRGNMQGALRYLSRAAQLPEGRDPVIFDHLGDALYRLGRPEEARQQWERALEAVRQREKDSQRRLTPTDRRVREQLLVKLDALAAGREVPVAALGEQVHNDRGRTSEVRKNASPLP